MPRHNEPTIVINGRTLSVGETMSLRVAVSSKISQFVEDPDALGTDDHARTMVKGYLKNLRSAQDTMLSERGLNEATLRIALSPAEADYKNRRALHSDETVPECIASYPLGAVVYQATSEDSVRFGHVKGFARNDDNALQIIVEWDDGTRGKVLPSQIGTV